MRWLLPVAIVVGVVAAAGSSSSTPAKPDSKWEARWEVLRPYAEQIEYQLDWHGLTGFLKVVAFMESRGRLDVSHDGGIGRGPFALHATTSSVQAIGGASALDLLTDPAVAVATAASHAYRLTRGTFAYPREDVRWQDVRAGWAIPGWTGDRSEQTFGKMSRAGVVSRFRERAAELGEGSIPATVAYLGGFPGLRWTLDVLGREDVAVDPDSPAA